LYTGAGNIGKQCNYVCYNRRASGVSRRGHATYPEPSDIVTVEPEWAFVRLNRR